MPRSPRSREPVVASSATSPAGDQDPSTASTLDDVWNLLQDIGSPGTVFVGGPAPMLPPLPGLRVNGIGRIPFPLGHEQAEKLAALGEPLLPHGRGNAKSAETVWHIDPDQVLFESPTWNEGLQKLVDDAAECLGEEPDQIYSTLSSLLLYEPGSSDTGTQDIAKADGAFAKLIIQLPSHHTGGSLIVRHGERSKTFAMGVGTDAAYNYHCVAHSIHCEHETTPVEGDYRLVLIYTLFCANANGGADPVAPSVKENVLRSVLRRLPPQKRCLFIPTEHNYSDITLSQRGLDCLRGNDRHRWKALENAGEGDWAVIVAKVERNDEEFGVIGYDGFECLHVEDSDIGPELYGEFQECFPYGILYRVVDTSSDDEATETHDLLLGVEGGIAELWGTGDGPVRRRGLDREYATRDTTYETSLLIAFSKADLFAVQCKYDFETAVEDACEDPSPGKVKTLLACVEDGTETLSLSDVQSLDAVIQAESWNAPQRESSNLKSMMSNITRYASQGIDSGLCLDEGKEADDATAHRRKKTRANVAIPDDAEVINID